MRSTLPSRSSSTLLGPTLEHRSDRPAMTAATVPLPGVPSQPAGTLTGRVLDTVQHRLLKRARASFRLEDREASTAGDPHPPKGGEYAGLAVARVRGLVSAVSGRFPRRWRPGTIGVPPWSP